MRLYSVIFSVLILTFSQLAYSTHATPAQKPVEKSLSILGFHGRVGLRQLSEDRVLVTIKTSHGVTTDTVRGHSVFPVCVNGKKQPFYAGKFGSSKFPMLIFAVTNPDMIQDSRVIAYQLAPGGGMIGQQVIVDQNMLHGHTDDVSGGRYQLAAINPELGAIYSVAYQDARFDGFFVSFEKLRIRQWDATVNAFLETDQGFLREKNGKIIETSHFHNLSEQKKEQLFIANLTPVTSPHITMRKVYPKVIPASAVR